MNQTINKRKDEFIKKTEKAILLLISFVLFFCYSSYPINGNNKNIAYNVYDFGAKGDGKNLDSKSINRAIEHVAEKGGGQFIFHRANTSRFPFILKVIFDAPEPNVWGDSLHYQDFGHSHWHNSLIWGDSLVNISILGPGMIWGKGLYRESKVPEGGGNKAIALKNCRNVNIRDISMLYCGHFAVLATGCDNMTFDNLKIDSQRDGINIDCCVNVRISNCSVNTPLDDAICLKSSFALGYARATENVTITNCNVTGYHTGTMLNGERKKEGSASHGRIKMGTESNGGFKNITISNCVFERCRGLALETVDGGLLEDVTISNITLRDVSNTPFFIRLGARMRGPEDVPRLAETSRGSASGALPSGSRQVPGSRRLHPPATHASGPGRWQLLFLKNRRQGILIQEQWGKCLRMDFLSDT